MHQFRLATKSRTVWVLCLITVFVLVSSLSACSLIKPGPQQWSQPPTMSIDPSKIYIATLHTEKGDIRIELFADKAPMTVNNFIFLAEEGFYDDTTFHRVIPGFMAQGGDPEGTGLGGPGYHFDDEFSPGLRFDDEGYLGMANSGPDSNGSQFFITYEPTPHLNGLHTIFGKVIEGMAVARALTPRDPMENPDFEGDVLDKIDIEIAEESFLPAPTETPIPIVPQWEEGRPLAELAIEDRENLYTGRPAMRIDPSKSYLASIQTTKGEIVVELRPQDAPESVNNFVFLAELGYWDQFPVAFIEPGFLVIIGSPRASQDSDIGYTLPAEIGLPNTVGAIGFFMRLDILAVSGSQFYILMSDVSTMDDLFPVFGYVTEGLDVVGSLTSEDIIETITIEER
jgi:cyclophilin family peptidyl-prolyl cis-trans isomerase